VHLFDCKILAMQTSSGGEYHKLSSFFDCIGITHLVSCLHTHQENGSAERKHHHVVEVGLALLTYVTMSLKFWDETFLSTIFLLIVSLHLFLIISLAMRSCLALNRRTTFYICLVAPSVQTYSRTIPTSLIFILSNAPSHWL
jgi:hypothetical protein